MSVNSNENYKRYNFQAFANISGNYGKIKIPENLQPYKQVMFSPVSVRLPWRITRKVFERFSWHLVGLWIMFSQNPLNFGI